MTNCYVCDVHIELTDSFNYPLYYYGAGPNNPQDAKAYFCGPSCAYKYIKKVRSDKNS